MNKVKVIIFLTLISSSTFVFGQKDSLIQLLNNSKSTAQKVDLYLELSQIEQDASLANSEKYAKSALQLSLNIKDTARIAKSYRFIGLAQYFQSHYGESVDSWLMSLSMYDSIGDKSNVARLYQNLGAIYELQSDDTTALAYNLKSQKVAEEISDTARLIFALNNIAVIYIKKKQTIPLSIDYSKKALDLAKKINDTTSVSTILTNLGESYFKLGKDTMALEYFEEALQSSKSPETVTEALRNIGKVYEFRGDYDNAERFQKQGLQIAEKVGIKRDVMIALVSLGITYKKKGSLELALKNFHQAEEIGKKIGVFEELKTTYEGLSEIYLGKNDFKQALKYQSLLNEVKDTLFNIDYQQKMSGQLFAYEIDKKQNQITILNQDKQIKDQEIKRQKVVRNGFIGGFAIVLLFAGVFLSQRNRISKEKKRSDELLLNILPEETAEELKATGSAKAKSFDSISVLFTDFKNFTQASEILSAEELVEEINQCYSEFDRIITKHGLEKIKTIGDSYMCAGGIPVKCEDHAERMVRAGLEMQAFIEDNKQKRMQANLPYFELRLGIHSGPVVAGVVGTKKFAYDIWGDTVNTASRMESSGAIGKVNISEATYELVKEKFKCVPRGKVAAKNKGEIEMYFVEGVLA